jgi:hypothetical protein
LKFLATSMFLLAVPASAHGATVSAYGWNIVIGQGDTFAHFLDVN